MKYYYHYSAQNDKGEPCLGYGDGRIIKEGFTHKVKGEIALCEFGLHASARPIDALQYAPGSWLSVCTLSGDVIHDADKSAASERTYIHVFNAERILRKAARKFALDVSHLWEMPDIVREYLLTGNKDIEAAAWDAAGAAARDAAGAAARDAARSAAWDAAGDAARDAARDAAWAAAWDAAGAAARDAAGAAARDAAMDEQNKYLKKLIWDEINGRKFNPIIKVKK